MRIELERRKEISRSMVWLTPVIAVATKADLVPPGRLAGPADESVRALLRYQAERARRMQASRIEWRDGAQLPFLGETVILVLDPRTQGAVLNTDAAALPGVPRLTLHLGLLHRDDGKALAFANRL